MKTRSVSFSSQAKDDLVELYDWIAEIAGPGVAIGYIDRLEGFCLGLGRGSQRGHARDDIRPGLRVIGFERRVTVAFLVEDRRVVVLGLFYGGRDWQSALS